MSPLQASVVGAVAHLLARVSFLPFMILLCCVSSHRAAVPANVPPGIWNIPPARFIWSSPQAAITMSVITVLITLSHHRSPEERIKRTQQDLDMQTSRVTVHRVGNLLKSSQILSEILGASHERRV